MVVSLVMRAASSAVIGSAIGEGGAAATAGGLEVEVEVVEEERLDADTMLSRALAPKTGGPRLRSS